MLRRYRTLLATTTVALLAGLAAAVAPDMSSAGGSVATLTTWTVAAPVSNVGVSTNRYGRALTPGFIGLSVEYWALHEYLGSDPAHINPLFVKLVTALAPGTRVQVRIGGISQDRTWLPVPGMARPPGVWYALNNNWLADAHAFEQASHARVTLGLNLASNSPLLAAHEAHALVKAVGSANVAALEIGNEPDLYFRSSWYSDAPVTGLPARTSGYSPLQYIADAKIWASMLPHLPLAGPALTTADWLPDTRAFATEIPGLKVFTSHHYPLWACQTNKQAGDYPTMANLLSNNSSAGLAKGYALSVQRAHAAGLTYRLDELGSVSCAGKAGVSNTLGAALWTVDTLFNFAKIGINGVNFHTLPGALYQPFTFTHSASGWQAHIYPPYYGVLMFLRAFPTGARLLHLSGPTGPMRVWAAIGRSGTIRVVLINESGSAARNIRLKLPGQLAALSTQILTGAGLEAHNVTLGGQSFGTRTSTATLGAPRTTLIEPRGGSYQVSVPAHSAVLLTDTAASG